MTQFGSIVAILSISLGIHRRRLNWTRDIIENVQLELVGERGQALPIEQLLMFPPSTEEANSLRLMKCPECGGRVRQLGREGIFCLECDWDNLPPLKHPR